MVSARPPPAPVNGRIPYPSADALTPGDVGQAPKSAVPLDWRRGSSAGEVTTTSSSTHPSGLGLQRLRSMRDRVRDRSRDRNTKPGRDRAGSVAVATLAQQPSNDTNKEMNERETSTQGLKAWWKAFSANRSATPSPPPYQPSFRHNSTTSTSTASSARKVFGTPLGRVLSYAAMSISTSGPDGSLYVWGEVPIIVGRCGSYLKQKADIEGIFRVSGSAKRMRDLQAIFDEGPTFGADINWDASPFTPHDVATIFRRYLTSMPEPVIPFTFYDQFRSVQTNEELSTEAKIREYKRLIRHLPNQNKFLLLYTLDLLGMVDQMSEKNLMPAANLAVIFQPGLLSHPGHEMRPTESALSKDVIELLITHQHQFVLPMAMKMSKRKHGHHSRSGTASNGVTAPQRPETRGRQLVEQQPGPVETGPTHLAVPEASSSTSQTQFAIPQSIPENGSLPDLVASSSTSPPSSGEHIVATRAEIDCLVPSDSDEEPPAGGYYIVETRPRTASPQPPSPRTPTSPVSMSSNHGMHTAFGVKDLITPARPPRSTKRGRPSVPNMPSELPTIDVMDPSDSDDDAPPGGYVVYENKRVASGSRGASPVKGANLLRSHTARTALQSADARANSPKTSEGATGLLRRRTLPTKRVSDFTARMRRAVLDA